MSEFEIVLVSWTDACHTQDKFDTKDREAIMEDVATPTVFSVGFKVAENNENIWISEGLIDDDIDGDGDEVFNGITVIPKCLISQVKHIDIRIKEKEKEMDER